MKNGSRPKNIQTGAVFCDLGGARTLDPMIKSHLLYQLSYEVSNLLSTNTRDLGGARTLDPMIKSHLLYQLSYEVIFRHRVAPRLRVQI